MFGKIIHVACQPSANQQLLRVHFGWAAQQVREGWPNLHIRTIQDPLRWVISLGKWITPLRICFVQNCKTPLLPGQTPVEVEAEGEELLVTARPREVEAKGEELLIAATPKSS